MSTFPSLQSNHQPNLNSRSIEMKSMGMKLILISVLALLMTLPSLYVGGLVSERSHGAADTVAQANTPQIFPGLSLHMVDSYRSVSRSLKYVLLFLGLVFVTYFIFEATTRRRVHPAQYVLVGTAQLIFYLLLLSLAEKIGFDYAFLIAGTATVGLLSVNASWVFLSRAQGTRAFVIFTILYSLIYMLLRMEDDALLIGAIASFCAVASVMYFTRRIDWYGALPGGGTLPTPPPQPGSRDATSLIAPRNNRAMEPGGGKLTGIFPKWN